jgi:DNA-binding transcriptional ArsR family regulator
MDTQFGAQLEARARILKAMAHPSRLLILEMLNDRPHHVAELTAAVGADVSTVSKHLSVLREAGIVAGERRGAQVRYSLRVPCVMNFFGCIEAVIRSRAEEQMRLLTDP